MFIHKGRFFLIPMIIFLFQGIFFSIMGAIFGLPTWEALYLQKTGDLGQGQILEISNSNTTINNVLQKNVLISFGYTERLTKIVPPSALNGMNSGDMVPVRYKKEDPNLFRMDYAISTGSLVIAFLFPGLGLILFLVGLFFVSKYRNAKERYHHISLYGQTTSAKILSIGNGSLTVNKVRYKKIELEFLGQTQLIKNIAPNQVAGYQVGDTIEVRYDSQRQADFMLVDKKELQNTTPF